MERRLRSLIVELIAAHSVFRMADSGVPREISSSACLSSTKGPRSLRGIISLQQDLIPYCSIRKDLIVYRPHFLHCSKGGPDSDGAEHPAFLAVPSQSHVGRNIPQGT